MEIVPLSEEHVAEVAALHVGAWRIAYREILPEEQLTKLSEERFTERWRTNLTRADRQNRLAVDDGRILGFVSFGPSHDEGIDPATTGEIYGMYVHPGHWRSGIGAVLMADALTHLTAQGFREVTLWTWERNQRARRFYEKHGFTHDGTTVLSDRFGAPLEEVRYRRPF